MSMRLYKKLLDVTIKKAKTVVRLELEIHYDRYSERVTSLMEMGLLPDFFGNFSMRGERYYFCMEESMQGEIEPM